MAWSISTAAALAILTWMLVEHPDWVHLALGLLCLGCLTAGLLSVLWWCFAAAGSRRLRTAVTALVIIKRSKISEAFLRRPH